MSVAECEERIWRNGEIERKGKLFKIQPFLSKNYIFCLNFLDLFQVKQLKIQLVGNIERQLYL